MPRHYDSDIAAALFALLLSAMLMLLTATMPHARYAMLMSWRYTAFTLPYCHFRLRLILMRLMLFSY